MARGSCKIQCLARRRLGNRNRAKITVCRVSAVQRCMQISGNAAAGLNYDVAVAKKALQSTREQGQQALQLIQAATPPANASVGSRLNVVA
jgi:hypothetical protein